MMTFLLFGHVVISLVGILAGIVVVFGLLGARIYEGWTAVFLATTVATSASGFLLPAQHFMRSHAVGIISLVVLAVAIQAFYGRRLRGAWRAAYAITAVLALWFNVFVGIVQAFLKIPFLHAMAPTQAEAPFKETQLAVLVLFVVIGGVASFRTPARGVPVP